MAVERTNDYVAEHSFGQFQASGIPDMMTAGGLGIWKGFEKIARRARNTYYAVLSAVRRRG